MVVTAFSECARLRASSEAKVTQLPTLSGRVLAPRSRRGSLNRRLFPSILILSVTRVSGFVAEVDAMAAAEQFREAEREGQWAVTLSINFH